MPRISPFSQMYPPSPAFTEKDIPDLAGKVYMVTGANTGIGKEIAGVLYSKNATVWLACRNEEKGTKAMEFIKMAHPSSSGKLEFLKLDLADMTTIKSSADAFLAKESRLDVLFNNAGVMVPPWGSKTAQGYEMQLGTNCLGTFLFTRFLTPLLVQTAKTSAAGAVRVIWVSSSAADPLSPKNGVPLDNLDYKNDIPQGLKYGVSKAGDYYYATEFARKHSDSGVVSIALNPGNLNTELTRTSGTVVAFVISLFCYKPIFGAYTELFAAFSDEVPKIPPGGWIVPWGRASDIRSDLYRGSKPESEGGTGMAEKFWAWSEEQVKPHL